MKKLKVFEAFAGIGAQHKALSILGKIQNLDFDIVATSEWDIFANISYNAIHHNGKIDKKTSMNKINDFFKKGTWSRDGKTPSTPASILKLDDELKRKVFSAIKTANNLGSILSITGQSLLNSIPNIDLLTYSFPCQDLSVAGSFHGFNKGMGRNSGTRSGLLWEVERIVRDLKSINKQPKFLLLENVKNMTSTKHIGHYNEWLKELKNMGYSTKTFHLNAIDYGLPQARNRVYALSIFNYSGKIDSSGEILDINNPQPVIKVNKKLKDCLRENYSEINLKEEAISAQPNRTESRRRMFYGNYKLNSKNINHTRTITTKQDRHPNAGVIDLKGSDIGDQNRKLGKANYRFLTPREAFLLMGFEDEDFEKVKKENLTNEKLYKQAGNSIPVYVLVAIFNEMIKHWDR